MGTMCSADKALVLQSSKPETKVRDANPSCNARRRPSSTLADLCLNQIADSLAGDSSTALSLALPSELLAEVVHRHIKRKTLCLPILAALIQANPLVDRLHLAGCSWATSAWLSPVSAVSSNLVYLNLSGCYGVELLGTLALSSLRVAIFHDCRGLGPTSFSLLSAAEDLEILDLSGCSSVRNDCILGLHSCAHLRDLNLSQCTAITDNCLLYVPSSLRRLNLEQCSGISDRGVLIAATRLQSLTALTLSQCSITNGALAMLAAHASQLELLAISGCRAIDMRGIHALASLTHLRSFGASQCPLVHGPHAAWQLLERLDLANSACDDAGLATIGRLPALTWIDLSQSRATVKALRALGQLTRLQHLKLTRTFMTDGVFCAISHALINLEFVDVAHTAVTDAGTSQLKHLSRLKTLVLSTPGITYHALPDLGTLARLESLDLFGASVADRGLEHLARLPRLRRLVLCGGCLTDRGVALLAESAPALTDLNISHNRGVHGAAASSLATLVQLRTLNISNTGIDAASLAHLFPLQRLETLLVYGVLLSSREIRSFTGRATLPFDVCFDCEH
ncbi:hypothetical protein ACHHYP_01439 [Achlya hypogyna]|uniref:Uncharacterized protein n=1 Tax=Achlya hypogyna TaxID=1202772 RepID=A0A1V9Z8K0_ACHHY|nr:hypothetical protein ACHHYP_01439 [Achlya hypogyna]